MERLIRWTRQPRPSSSREKRTDKTIVIDDKTKITKSGKEMAFADLKMGMNVSVEYKKDGDKMVATTVKAAAPKAAKEKK